MSLLKKLQAEAATNTAAQTKTKTETKAAEPVADFAISEAEIKKNPAYQIITDTKKSELKRIEALTALRVYNQELTKEENARNLQAYNEFLLYSENKILEITQRSVDFTNDEAFSLFDTTIQKLQANLGVFKGHLEPLVAAFGVMQKARANGIPPHKLLTEVQNDIENKKKLDAERAAKQEALDAAKGERAPIEAEANAQAASLAALQAKIEQANTDKAAAEGIKKAEEDKNFFFRNKAALAEAVDTIARTQSNIETHQRAINTLAEISRTKADSLERKNGEIAALEAEIQGIEGKIAEIDSKIGNDEDALALAKLLEITGTEFKEKRQELTDSVKSILSSSVNDFERSMARFESGEKEVGVMKDTVSNIGGMIQLVAKADAKVRVQDAGFVSEQETIVKRIQDEKGDEAVYDPAYEVAKQQLELANAHVKESMTIMGRTGEFAEKLTRHEGTYTGLKDAFRQKYMDAQRLRTNAAVEVSSKLLTTTKTLEMAIAGEKTTAVDDMLAEMSESSSKATKDIFNMLTESKTAENERLADALKQAIDASQAIDTVTKELREKTREGLATREGIRQVQEELTTLNEGLSSVSSDVERELQGKGLKQAGEAAAMRAAGVQNPAAPKP